MAPWLVQRRRVRTEARGEAKAAAEAAEQQRLAQDQEAYLQPEESRLVAEAQSASEAKATEEEEATPIKNRMYECRKGNVPRHARYIVRAWWNTKEAVRYSGSTSTHNVFQNSKAMMTPTTTTPTTTRTTRKTEKIGAARIVHSSR